MNDISEVSEERTIQYALLQRIHDLEVENNRLHQALSNKNRGIEGSKIIDQAKRLLMVAYKCNEEDAYRDLQRASMSKRITLVEEAQRIIDVSKGIIKENHYGENLKPVHR